MIAVRRFITADNVDLLAGTDLDNVPVDTRMLIYAAATQNDHTLTLTVPAIQSPLRANPVTLRANAEIRLNEDLVTAFTVKQNGHVVVNCDVVTAGTLGVLVIAPDA